MTAMERPTTLEEGKYVDPLRTPLSPHRSDLPDALYIFSFAPALPPISKPREFFDHPIVLYTIGTIAAAAAGVGLPAFDIVTGVWTDGITPLDATDSEIVGAGQQAGWIMTVVGVAFVLCFGIFLYCCKHLSLLSRRDDNRADANDSHHCCYQAVEPTTRAVSLCHRCSGPGLL